MSRKDEIRELIIRHNRRLQELKKQQAFIGLQAPPHISLEIEDIEIEINKLKAELAALETDDFLENLEQGNNVTRESLKHQLDIHSTKSRLQLYLPPKAYHRLIGRSEELDQVLNALHNRERMPMIAVVGFGGMGKTALAREAVEYCDHENLFNWIVWTSAKTEHFVSEDVIKSSVFNFGFDQLLNEIGSQCGWKTVAKAPKTKKIKAIQHLLATRRVLIILDNLETVPEKDTLINDFFQILGKSKLLITSRFHVKHERVLAIKLDGLTEEEGIVFLREESSERGIKTVAQARREDLGRIHMVTGGAPLAMKLVIGQMSRLPMDTVLKELKEVKLSSEDYPFYRFILKHSWDLLKQDAKDVLVSMSVFPPGIGGQEADLRTVSEVEESAFRSALDQLVSMSLVDPVGDLQQRRYSIHQLTHYFILSDIVKKWG